MTILSTHQISPRPYLRLMKRIYQRRAATVDIPVHHEWRLSCRPEAPTRPDKVTEQDDFNGKRRRIAMITKERPNTARQTGRVLEDVKIHVKIKLAVLWVALMFLYIYADIKALFQPGIMEQLDVEQVALQDDTEARICELTGIAAKGA